MPRPVARVVKGIVLTIVCALVIIPFLGIFATSVAPAGQLAANNGFVLWPEAFSLDAYRSILSGGVVSGALVISVGVTLVGTALSLSATALMAYALARPSTIGRAPVLTLLLLSLLFTPGMIPTYLIVKQIGLLDSLWALILPSMLSAFNVIVMRSFFQGIPGELIDSAKIDGATEWQIFRLISLPLSKAVLAVIGLFYAVQYWNAFFNALLYLNDSSLWPLQMVLRTYVVNGTNLSPADLGPTEILPPQPAIQMAILVVSFLPIVCVYPFLQKYFAKGVLTGAVKG
ncbi:carbohydrate ABC transporter permease [Jiangella endophytica]|uniref:carbohydrate ABC transporter permease n=1 Tax=Jiangella endophytica TaxID=1623398 RepID=UPI0018E51CBC|nr:carbohydrate ABC transporter permease [Jiangella endophytica]